MPQTDGDADAGTHTDWDNVGFRVREGTSAPPRCAPFLPFLSAFTIYRIPSALYSPSTHLHYTVITPPSVLTRHRRYSERPH